MFFLFSLFAEYLTSSLQFYLKLLTKSIYQIIDTMYQNKSSEQFSNLFDLCIPYHHVLS